MNKVSAAFLAAIMAVMLAIGVPIAVYATEAFFMWVAGRGLFTYATIMACAAYPFLYLMLRRMNRDA